MQIKHRRDEDESWWLKFVSMMTKKFVILIAGGFIFSLVLSILFGSDVLLSVLPIIPLLFKGILLFMCLLALAAFFESL
jgi:hypothetical protein